MDASRQHQLLSRMGRLSGEQLDLVERFLDLLNETTPSVRVERLPEEHSVTDTQRIAAQVSAAVASAVASTAASQHRNWPHAPLHRICEAGTYFVTSGTLHKEHIFRGEERLDFLESKLLASAKEHGWQLEAWAAFSNHYHFVARCGKDSADLKLLLKELHGATAREVNKLDKSPGRQVWHNYWDTQLTYEKSYLARLNYTHQNAVKHGLVPIANQYRWCSATWFERTATAAQVKTIYGFKIDKVHVPDDFEPV